MPEVESLRLLGNTVITDAVSRGPEVLLLDLAVKLYEGIMIRREHEVYSQVFRYFATNCYYRYLKV